MRSSSTCSMTSSAAGAAAVAAASGGSAGSPSAPLSAVAGAWLPCSRAVNSCANSRNARRSTGLKVGADFGSAGGAERNGTTLAAAGVAARAGRSGWAPHRPLPRCPAPPCGRRRGRLPVCGDAGSGAGMKRHRAFAARARQFVDAVDVAADAEAAIAAEAAVAIEYRQPRQFTGKPLARYRRPARK